MSKRYDAMLFSILDAGNERTIHDRSIYIVVLPWLLTLYVVLLTSYNTWGESNDLSVCEGWRRGEDLDLFT